MKKKSKVSMILAFLERMSPDSVTPKMVSKALRLDDGLVRATMSRLAREGRIDRELHGFYRTLKMDILKGVPYEELLLHGVNIQIDCKKVMTPSYLWSTSKATNPIIRHFTYHKHRTNGSLIVHRDYDGRKVTVTIHQKAKKILIAIAFKRSKDAMNVLQFYGFCEWLKGYIPEVPWELWQVLQYAWNIDIHPFSIESHVHTSVRIFLNTWLEVYEKEKDTVRIGVHSNQPISLEDIAKVCYDAKENALNLSLRNKTNEMIKR